MRRSIAKGLDDVEELSNEVLVTLEQAGNVLAQLSQNCVPLLVGLGCTHLVGKAFKEQIELWEHLCLQGEPNFHFVHKTLNLYIERYFVGTSRCCLVDASTVVTAIGWPL